MRDVRRGGRAAAAAAAAAAPATRPCTEARAYGVETI